MLREGYIKGLKKAREVIERMITESATSSADRLLLNSVLTGSMFDLRNALDDGADVEASDSSGRTALHSASMEEGYEDMAALLLKYGADVDAVDDYGFTPLRYAAFYGVVENCQLLLDNGADVNAACRGGTTPLHWAARGGWYEVCELLLSHGANAFAEDYQGKTPLDVSVGDAIRDLLIDAMKSTRRLRY